MFELGKISVTELALHTIQDSHQQPEEFLDRHAAGDWGEVSEETRERNELAMEAGHRIESVYHTAKAEKILVVTEADRSLTSVMVPEEF